MKGLPLYVIFLFLSLSLSVFPVQDWEVLVLQKLKWDLVSVIANDFLAHILHQLPIPKDKVELVKKHAQTFIALCATGEQQRNRAPGPHEGSPGWKKG